MLVTEDGIENFTVAPRRRMGSMLDNLWRLRPRNQELQAGLPIGFGVDSGFQDRGRGGSCRMLRPMLFAHRESPGAARIYEFY